MSNYNYGTLPYYKDEMEKSRMHLELVKLGAEKKINDSVNSGRFDSEEILHIAAVIEDTQRDYISAVKHYNKEKENAEANAEEDDENA